MALIVKSIDGDPVLVGRLYELGFYPGQKVVRRYELPFMGPVVFEMNGALIALRRNELKCITFEEETKDAEL